MLPNGGGIDLYPEDLREKIDELNEWIYHDGEYQYMLTMRNKS
jgi:glutathionyl-hydroquinone reductase